MSGFVAFVGWVAALTKAAQLTAWWARDTLGFMQKGLLKFLSPQKTQRPVQFEITPTTRDALQTWIKQANLKAEDYLFPSRIHASPHLGTRQYARVLESWVTGIGLDASAYGTHSMRRSKASLIYRRTKNLRAVQLLLGHTRIESTVRYLGIDVDDALELAEQTEV
jgi:integrase